MEKQYKKTEGKDFGQEVSKKMPLIAREFIRRLRKTFSQGALTVPQLVILDFLRERSSAQMSELAKALGFSMSAVTAIVDKMIEHKLVKRERPQEDRRVVRITLLNKGKKMIERINEGRRNIVNDLFSVLTEAEKNEYIRIIRKIVDSLEKRQ